MAVKSLLAACAAALAMAAAAAQALPDPTLPLNDADWFQCWQSHGAKACTTANLAAYLAGKSNTFGPPQTFAGGLTTSSISVTGSATFNVGLAASSISVTGPATFSGLAGSFTQCVQINAAGVLSGAGAACGNGNNLTGDAGLATVATSGGAAALKTRFGAWCDPVADYGADPTGVASSSTAINSCLASGRPARLPAGTYSLTAALTPIAGAQLVCADGAKITQPNGQNLRYLVDFSLNSANGASIQGCTVDGNRAHNTDADAPVLINIGIANDVHVEGNTLQNGTGAAIDITTGLRYVVDKNVLTNFYIGGVFVNGTAGLRSRGKITNNTLSSPMGQHAITVWNSDYNLISQNNINSNLQAGTVVNVAGTAVTWVSGPDFSTYNTGEFVLVNGGTEETICAINTTSYTSLTLCHPHGTLSGVPMASGVGDLISLVATSHNTISLNTTFGGVTSGIVLSNYTSGEPAAGNNIIDNVINNTGGSCISVQSTSTYGTIVIYNAIRSNHLTDCGLAGAAANTNFVGGIQLADFASSTLLDTTITDNIIVDDQATPTLINGVSLSGVANGHVFYGHNTVISSNISNFPVKNGISSVSLDAGWGSAATYSATSYGDSFFLSITSNGTGQTSNSGVHVNMPATPSGNPPAMSCQETTNATSHSFVYNQQPGTFSANGVQVFFWQGTPVAGTTYNFLCRG